MLSATVGKTSLPPERRLGAGSIRGWKGMFRRMRRGSSFSRAVLAATLLAGTAAAADLTAPITQYRRTFRLEEFGLSIGEVRDIVQTPEGYIWLASPLGVVRFDGVRFTPFSLRPAEAGRTPSADRLLAGGDGSLWIGTAEGLVRCRDGRFETFTARDGLPADPVTALGAGSGGVWVGTPAGLALFRGSRVSRVYRRADGLPSDDIRAVVEAGDGCVWVGTAAGPARIVRGEVARFGRSDAAPAGAVRSILADSRGGVWLAEDGGLFRLDAGRWAQVAGASAAVGLLREDRDGNVWIGTAAGLLRSRKGNPAEPVPGIPGASTEAVTALLEDSEGGLWVAADGELVRFEDAPVTLFGKAQGLADDFAWTVSQGPDGDVWIGTGRGLSRFRGTDLHPVWTGKGVGAPAVLTVLADRAGRVWVGTDQGLWRFEAGALVRPAGDGPDREIVLALHEGPRGEVWAAGGGRLFRYRDGRLVRSYGRGDGLGDTLIRAVAEDLRGDVWLGTNGSGLLRLSAGGVTRYAARDGLLSPTVTSILADSTGTVWVGTESGGLHRFRDGRFARFGARDGLPGGPVYSILEDGPDHLWVSSGRGIVMIPRRQIDEVAAGRRDRVDVVAHAVMGGGEVASGVQPAAWKASDGSLWIPTSRGVARLDPARIRVGATLPPPRLEEIALDGESGPAATPLRVPPGRHHLEFRFTGFHYHDPLELRFRYRLAGYDRGWIESRGGRTAQYTNTPPGRYAFLLESSVPGSRWAAAESPVTVVTAPFWWQTWGFRIIFGLAVLGALAAVFHVRNRSLVKRRKDLERLVESRTDQLRREVEQHQAVVRSLRESEARVALAASSARLALWEWRLDTGRAVVGSSWREITGLDAPAGPVPLDWWLTTAHPRDTARVHLKLQSVRSGPAESVEMEFRSWNPVRGWTWISATARVIERERGGAAARLIGLVQDVTERKRNEQRLRDHAQELERFNRVMVDREMRIIEIKEEVNRLCERLGEAPVYPEIWKGGTAAAGGTEGTTASDATLPEPAPDEETAERPIDG